jgi:uncharacterized protein (TIGR03437 family)
MNELLKWPSGQMVILSGRSHVFGIGPGFAGLYQVNAIVPGAAPSGDTVSLVISIGGVQSNIVTIAVQ